jgi:hypothetical protein
MPCDDEVRFRAINSRIELTNVGALRFGVGGASSPERVWVSEGSE